jgi:hypothetical protein
VNDDRIADIYESMGGLHAKVDTLLSQSHDQEKRIRSLEATKARFLGIIAAVTLIGTGLWQAALALFEHKTNQ